MSVAEFGVLRAPQILGTPTSYSASDSFTSTTDGVALNARVAPLGGTWATSGDATDFTFRDDLGGVELVGRNAVGATGRFGILGSTNYTSVIVESEVSIGSILAFFEQVDAGVIARWTDSSNYVRGTLVQVNLSDPADQRYLEIRQTVAGVASVLAISPTMLTTPIGPEHYVLRLTVLANGQVTLALLNTAKTVTYASVTGSSSALATGGTLATGKPGIYDRNTGVSTFIRTYDNFRVLANPPLDAVLYPSQSVELRTTGPIREDTGGTSYARVESNVGCLPRLPVSGLENRKVELYVKASRGNFDQYPDTGIDDISAQVFYRPAWLLTPGS